LAGNAALPTNAGTRRPAIARSTDWVAPPPAWVVWLALGAATLVAVGLRAASVGDQSLGYEEVFTSSIVRQGSASGVWHALRATESTPPLYYYLTWVWVRLTGDHSAVAIRTTAVLAGIATVPVVFMAMRRFVGDGLSVVVAWLCAISPLLLEYSIYARSYALLVLVTTLSLWALGALLERPSPKRWAVWTLTGVVCIWTHYFAAFTLVGEAVVLFLVLPKDRAKLALSVVAIAVAFAPVWSLFRAQSRATGRTAFITARPLRSRLEDVARQFAMGTNVPHAWLEGAGIAATGAAVVFAAARMRRRRPARVLGLLAVIGAGLPILAAAAGVADYLLARNIIGVLICLAPLVAYGLTRWRGVPLVAYSGLCLLAVVGVQTNWRYQGSPDWAGVGALVGARTSGEPVAVIPAMDVSVAALYLGRAALAGSLSTRDLWVMAEPVRAAHQRALAPLADVPLGLWGGSLRRVAEVDYRGFRLIHLHSSLPSVVAAPPPGAAGGLTPAVLAP
jgi:4-amino-4-deoxy-L-arabinose transferase-like glycosyltransferase